VDSANLELAILQQLRDAQALLTSESEIRLFLIVSLQNNPVAADAKRHSPRLVPLFARMLPKPSYDQAVNKAKLAANGKLGILIGFLRLPIGEHSELEVVTLHHSWRFIV
jgi:hypothetical protein